LGLYESLRAAQLAIRDEQRRPAIARAVELVVRADHRDPRMADLAVQTLDLDRLAAALAARVDYDAWADRLAPAITAPSPTTNTGPAGSRTDVEATAGPPEGEPDVVGDSVGTAVLRPDTVADIPGGAAAGAPAPEHRAPAEMSPVRRPDPVDVPVPYQPSSDEDRIMYDTWQAGVAAGAEPSGAELARAAGRANDDSGVGRRAARRYREAHATAPPTAGPPDADLATAVTARAAGSDAEQARRNGHHSANRRAAA
jgi:hypothetical protein